MRTVSEFERIQLNMRVAEALAKQNAQLCLATSALVRFVGGLLITLQCPDDAWKVLVTEHPRVNVVGDRAPCRATLTLPLGTTAVDVDIQLTPTGATEASVVLLGRDDLPPISFDCKELESLASAVEAAIDSIRKQIVGRSWQPAEPGNA